MMNLLLSPRLKIIADSIKGYDTVADIGSDHAYLPLYLVKHKQVKSVIATDVNKGPVRIAKGRVSSHGAEAEIKVRQGDGLQAVRPGEAEVIVLAGMGGLLIRDILDRDVKVARSARLLILQPMRDSDKLRRWLLLNGFDIVDEELVKEQDRIYEVLWAVPAEGPKAAEGLLLVGDRIIEKRHPLMREFINRKTDELEKVMAALEGMDTENCRERAAECRAMLDFYREVAE
ncbi:MAG TPA: class I SAM-dependent methyltransferase [Clostridia bacterium]|nr:class I SAM-dependent methyltransferase [Clostridia bacterium]